MRITELKELIENGATEVLFNFPAFSEMLQNQLEESDKQKLLLWCIIHNCKKNTKVFERMVVLFPPTETTISIFFSNSILKRLKNPKDVESFASYLIRKSSVCGFIKEFEILLNIYLKFLAYTKNVDEHVKNIKLLIDNEAISLDEEVGFLMSVVSYLHHKFQRIEEPALRETMMAYACPSLYSYVISKDPKLMAEFVKRDPRT